MTLEEALAHESIRQTLSGYTVAGDTRDAALFHAQFAEDATLEFAGFPPLPDFKHEGIAAIQRMTAAWIKLPATDPTLKSATFIRHNLTTSRIELTGKDTATARTYFVVFTNIGPDHAGIYSDQLARHGERWLFAHRRITLDWRSPDSIFPPVKR
jgi:hypothetical protein